MSITLKSLTVLFFLMVLPFQKEKDKCLIIFLGDNNQLYSVGTIGNYVDQFYLNLKYPNPPNNDIDEENPLVPIPYYLKNPTGTSYNLQNRQRIETLPDSVAQCNCASLKKFNLGMEFKSYVEKENDWVTFDAKKLLVEE